MMVCTISNFVGVAGVAAAVGFVSGVVTVVWFLNRFFR